MMLTFADTIETALADLETQFDARFGDDITTDTEDGVLRIEFNDGRVYLFNRHEPLRQLWLSSPVSGAWHFAPARLVDQGLADWRSTRGQNISLYELLNQELSPDDDFTAPVLG